MKSIELFAGIGGIALAAQKAGIETIALCEKNPFCQKVLEKNFPGIPIFDDIKTFTRDLLEQRGVIEKDGAVDLISGGFPCQPYSISGKRKGKEDDRDLWGEMFRIIQEFKPRWIVGENVANFANMELERTVSDLESTGYETQSFIIPACSVNAPHRRERIFIVSYLVKHGCNSRSRDREERHFQNDKEQHLSKIQPKREGFLFEFGEVNSIFGWGAHQPRMGRVANGIPNRMDRIIALGNAVVPAQIYPIFKAIMEIENMEHL